MFRLWRQRPVGSRLFKTPWAAVDLAAVLGLRHAGGFWWAILAAGREVRLGELDEAGYDRLVSLWVKARGL